MSRRTSWLLPAGVLLAGLASSAAGAWWLHARIQSDARAAFQRDVMRAANDIRERFRKPVYGLKGARGAYATRPDAQHYHYRRYVASRNMAMEFQGLRGFGFLPHVDQAASAAQAAGLDADSASTLREGALGALRSGVANTSGLVTLIRDQRRELGVVIHLPVFADGAQETDADAADARGALRGLLYAPILISDLLQGLDEVLAGQVKLEIFDSPSGTAEGPRMYDSAAAWGGGAAPRAARFEALRSVEIPGRLLTIRVRSSPAFEAAHLSTPAWMLAVVGVLASGLLAALMRRKATEHDRARQLAQEMTVDLANQKFALDQHAIVSITDLQGRITYVNQRFCDISGYTQAELIGQNHRIIGSGRHAPGFFEDLWATISRGDVWHGEVCNRNKSGSEYWVDATVVPLVGVDGRPEKYIAIRTDITQSKAAERQALELTVDLANQKFALDQHAIVSITDLQGTITYVNQLFCELSGYSQAELIGQNHRIISSGLHPAAFFDELWATISRGEVWHGQVCNRHKNGSEYWVDATVVPLVGVDGLPERYVAIRTDITQNKAAERQLARKRQSLQNIIEGTQVGTWEWNVETGQALFNERWAQIVGCTLAELGPTTLHTWRELTHPEDLKRLEEALEQHIGGHSASFECESRMRHRQGHWVWVLDRGKLFATANGGAPWMAGTRMDITERRQAEAVLRANQTLLSQTGRMGGVGGWELDVASRALSWTDQTCRIHDLPPGYRPREEDAARFYTPTSQQLLEQAMAACLATGQRWDLELSMTTASGRPIWVRSVGEAEFSEGRPVRVFGAIQDTSDRIAMNAALLRTAELERSNEELERFAYITSHDLQEPLRMVISYGQLLKRRHLAELKPEAQEFLGYMVDGGQRAHALIRDLLSLARLDSRAEPWTTVSLDAVLAGVLRPLRLRIQELGAEISHDPLPEVMADAAQIGQLMANLVGNALKFHRARPPRIHIAAVREDSGWRISVQDNGIGIDPRYFDRIFQMFQRLHQRTEYEGTGIGLAICKKVVERHGGRLGVESTPGQGSIFSFTLPDHAPGLQAAAALAAARQEA